MVGGRNVPVTSRWVVVSKPVSEFNFNYLLFDDNGCHSGIHCRRGQWFLSWWVGPIGSG